VGARKNPVSLAFALREVLRALARHEARRREM
jgi:hypothetical protein